MKMINQWILFCGIWGLLAMNGVTAASAGELDFINLIHLEHLSEEVEFQGRPCTIVHIYSDYPDYPRTQAAGEGIACVDDVARAVVLYISLSELRQDTLYAPRIRRLLNFVLGMQIRSGHFYNFIRENYQINPTGSTSYPSFGFWAARGYWALGAGYRFFYERDSRLAAILRAAFLRCLNPTRAILADYNRFETVGQRNYPVWLMNKYAGDATSEFLLGLAAFLSVEAHPELARAAALLADGLLQMQIKTPGQFLGAFESWPGFIHPWGNAQVQALCQLGQVLQNAQYLAAARLSTQHHFVRLLAHEWFHEYDLGQNLLKPFPQIAYDIRPVALGLLEFYRYSRDENDAILAGLAASWLTGNNVAGVPMYDPATGRGYDGLDAKGRNNNAGAESTIEALYTLSELFQEPTAQFWLHGARCTVPGRDDYSDASGFLQIFCRQDHRVLISADNVTQKIQIMPIELDGEQP